MYVRGLLASSFFRGYVYAMTSNFEFVQFELGSALRYGHDVIVCDLLRIDVAKFQTSAPPVLGIFVADICCNGFISSAQGNG